MDDPRTAGRALRAAAPSLLDRYESIAVTSRAMVDAAHRQDWAEVRELEKDCLKQVNQLKAAARVHSLSRSDQSTRMRLLRSILADDAEIRRLAEPWLAELEHLLLPQPRAAARRAKPAR
jgi:flagellar protein FliT